MDSRETPPIRPAGPGWAAEAADPEKLARYGQFLASEALPAGGLGPHEGQRLEDRHIADALGFSAAWHGEAAPPAVLDVGSGVGLPGIPLAILWPGTKCGLVERSGRRARLLRRAVRILELANVSVLEGDVATLDFGEWERPGVVMRAVFPPVRAPTLLTSISWERLVIASGTDDGAAWGNRIPYHVFARVGWLRTMRRP